MEFRYGLPRILNGIVGDIFNINNSPYWTRELVPQERLVCSWCPDPISACILQGLQKLARYRGTLCRNKNQHSTFYGRELTRRFVASPVSLTLIVIGVFVTTLSQSCFPLKYVYLSSWIASCEQIKSIQQLVMMFCTDPGCPAQLITIREQRVHADFPDPPPASPTAAEHHLAPPSTYIFIILLLLSLPLLPPSPGPL